MNAPNEGYGGQGAQAGRPFVGMEAFFSGKEIPQMILLPKESWNQFTEVLSRIAEVVERLGPKEEVKEEPIQRMLTPQEASKKMHLHVQTVMEWCRDGKITATKLGRKWLISKEEVDRHLHRYEVINGRKKGAAK